MNIWVAGLLFAAGAAAFLASFQRPPFTARPAERTAAP